MSFWLSQRYQANQMPKQLSLPATENGDPFSIFSGLGRVLTIHPVIKFIPTHWVGLTLKSFTESYWFLSPYHTQSAMSLHLYCQHSSPSYYFQFPGLLIIFKVVNPIFPCLLPTQSPKCEQMDLIKTTICLNSSSYLWTHQWLPTALKMKNKMPNNLS